jgi:hypothetical protein
LAPAPTGTPLAGAPVEARVGSKAGAAFRIKGAQVEGTKEAAIWTGTVPAGWTRIAVLASVTGKGARFWSIEPEPDARGAIEFEGFYLRGPFRIAELANNERRAREKFGAFRG